MSQMSVVCLLVLLSATAGAALGQDVPAAIHTLSHAGLELTLPAGFVLTRPDDGLMVLSARRGETEAPDAAALTISAVPVDASMTLEQFVAAAMDPNVLAVQNLEAAPAETLTVADSPARAISMTYSVQGKPAAARRVFWLRPMGGPGSGKLGYVLTVETAPSAAPAAAAGAVTASIRHRPIASPQGEPIELPEQAEAFEQLGLSLALPQVWKIRQAPHRLLAFQTDYTAGAMPAPLLRITSLAAGDDASAESELQRVVNAASRVWSGQGLRLGEQGTGRLLGAESRWLILQMDGPDGPVISAVETVIHQGRAVHLTLTLQGPRADAGSARAMLAAIGRTLTPLPADAEQP